MSHAARIFTRRHHRRRHFLAISTLAGLIAWGIIWGLTAHHMSQKLDHLIAQATKEGAVITYNKRYINGNPFSIHAHLDPLHIKLKNGNEINAKESVFYLKLWDWNHIEGKLRDGINAKIMETALTAGIVRFGFATPKNKELTTQEKLAFWIQPLGVNFDKTQKFTLGNRMEEALFRMHLVGPLPNFSKPESLHEWRNAGGMIEFDELRLNWGPLYVSARGNVALDENLQPQGAFAGRVKGLDETIGMLAVRNKIDDSQLSLLRATMGVLARPASMTGGNTSSVLPVTLHNSRLYFGPVKLMELPVLKW